MIPNIQHSGQSQKQTVQSTPEYCATSGNGGLLITAATANCPPHLVAESIELSRRNVLLGVGREGRLHLSVKRHLPKGLDDPFAHHA